jgi:hypothetical protein
VKQPSFPNPARRNVAHGSDPGDRAVTKFVGYWAAALLIGILSLAQGILEDSG